MPVGTEFNISDEENNVKVIIKSSDEFRNKLSENSAGFISKKFICWANTGEEITLGDYEASLKFIPIQKPVSFVEAAAKEKRIKLDISNVNLLEDIKEEFNKFLALSEVIKIASEKLSSFGLKKIFTEYKWFVEEE